MVQEYAYQFGPDGHITCPSGDVLQSTAHTSLDGVEKSTWLGPFGPPERDLLRVMAAVLEADRLSPRQSVTAPGHERLLGWQRRLRLKICVEAPDRWSSGAQDLQGLLSFMTDDAWEFEFAGILTPPKQQCSLPFERTIREVALFSGGLDSVAGLFAEGTKSPGSVLAVSAYGNDILAAAQMTARQTLQDLRVNVTALKIKHQLRGTGRRRNGMESSQRSRGLLFLAMGAAAASELKLDTFRVYETGTGCINLPITPAQVGAQGTRAMHPRTLALFNQLSTKVLERRVRVIAPFFFLTKGQLCALAGDNLGQLAKVSMSCDEGEGHKADRMLHCGLCTSCLFRRIALRAAGLLDDPTHYRDVKTKRHGVYEVNAFEVHATSLRACRSFNDLVGIDPDARFAKTPPVEISMAPERAEAAVFEMYQRYATEIGAYLAEARPNVALPRHGCERGAGP